MIIIIDVDVLQFGALIHITRIETSRDLGDASLYDSHNYRSSELQEPSLATVNLPS